MSKKLFVGNVAWKMSDEELRDMFASYGDIEDAVIIKDRMSGRSKGFGFVTFTNDADADKAAEALNGKDVEGRKLVVNEARPLRPRA